MSYLVGFVFLFFTSLHQHPQTLTCSCSSFSEFSWFLYFLHMNGKSSLSNSRKKMLIFSIKITENLQINFKGMDKRGILNF